MKNITAIQMQAQVVVARGVVTFASILNDYLPDAIARSGDDRLGMTC